MLEYKELPQRMRGGKGERRVDEYAFAAEAVGDFDASGRESARVTGWPKGVGKSKGVRQRRRYALNAAIKDQGLLGAVHVVQRDRSLWLVRKGA